MGEIMGEMGACHRTLPRPGKSGRHALYFRHPLQRARVLDSSMCQPDLGHD